MEKISIDTANVKTAAADIRDLANDYNKIILDIYNKLVNIETNEVWISDSENGSAKKFVENVKKEMANYINLSKELKIISNKIISYANSLENIFDANIFIGGEL